MNTSEAKEALKKDLKNRKEQAQTEFKAAMERMKALGFMVVPIPVTMPTASGGWQLAAQLQFVEIPVE